MTVNKLVKDALQIQSAAETERITERRWHLPSREVKRRGISWDLCGGIDKFVAEELLVGAGGRQRVAGLMITECHS